MLVSLLEKNLVPLAVSLGLHALVAAALLAGWESPAPPPQIQRPNFVQATLVQLEAKAQQVAPPDQPRVVDLRRREEERQRLEAERRRQQEAQRRQEQERRRAEEERQQRERRAKEEAERKAREDAERRRAETERQQQEQRQRDLQAFDQALAREQAQLAEAEYAVAAQSFIAAISRRIEQNWSRPPSARLGMECELLIRLVPTGRVISVDVVRSSGNALFDRSAIQAVQKTEQFPEIREMPSEVFERYYRELRLLFRPQDLRQ